jgi:hypothetical protein
MDSKLYNIKCKDQIRLGSGYISIYFWTKNNLGSYKIVKKHLDRDPLPPYPVLILAQTRLSFCWPLFRPKCLSFDLDQSAADPLVPRLPLPDLIQSVILRFNGRGSLIPFQP